MTQSPDDVRERQIDVLLTHSHTLAQQIAELTLASRRLEERTDTRLAGSTISLLPRDARILLRA